MYREGWDRRDIRRPTVDDLGDPPTTARWLAWATAILLIIGVVSAGVMNIAGGGSDDGLVTAAGRDGGTFVVPTTTVPLPVPSTQSPTPASTIARSTTVPKAAAAVLKAIASTTTTTTRPPTATTTTTAPPVTTTTVKPLPTTTTTAPAPTTTSTTVPLRAALTVANDLTQTFVVTVDGRTFELAQGQEAGPVDVTLPAGGNDVVEVHAKDDAACTVGSTSHLFQPGSSYRLTVVAGSGPACRDSAAPDIKVVLVTP
jgi:hypothetical protein